MTTDIVFGETKFCQSKMVHSPLECIVDMSCGDLHRLSRGNKIGADGCVVVGSIGHNVGDPPG